MRSASQVTALAVVLSSGVLGAQLVAPRAAAAAPTLAVDDYRLDNGLRVILHRDTSSPTVVVHVWYHVGSKDEVKGRTGFAHLFEHLMFKGSKHVPDGDFDRMLESAGGWNNGTTNNDRTNYFEQVPKNFLGLALYLEADRMAGLWDGMDQSMLDNQRDVVKNERRQSYENQPYGKAELAIQQALWPEGHGNHNLTIGTMEDLSAASLADVEAFYRNYYLPNNATLVIAGDLDIDATKQMVARYFGWMPKGATPRHVTLTEPVKPRDGEVILRETDQVEASKVSLTWRTPEPFGTSEVALRVAADILGGGKTSRLYKRLVFDERKASSVSAYSYPLMLGGEFQIAALARDGASTAELLAAIDEEITRLSTEGPTEDEVLRARRVAESELLQGLESLSARADRLAEYAAYTTWPDAFDRELAAYRAVTAADIRAAAKAWLGKNARVVMFVDPKESK